ncbi:MAG TPA: transaldolase, partial [Candidatus Rothia avistercoris]|nr:transaldolase [Candidatus Rothia avistercoris]
ALRGKAGVANARLAFEVYEQAFSSERWARLEAAGANRQRPLWASTGVKNPAYPDTLYVTEIAAPGTVNTMPEATLNATFDHAEVAGNAIEGTYEESTEILNQLEAVGISYNDVVEKLETEGVEKFEVSWKELLDTVTAALSDSK